MGRLKVKQLGSNMLFDAGRDQLIVNSSKTPTAEIAIDQNNDTWNDAFNTWEVDVFTALIVSGSVEVTSSNYQRGTITIADADTFGDKNSFYSIDLGTYDETAEFNWELAEINWESAVGTWDGSELF